MLAVSFSGDFLFDCFSQGQLVHQECFDEKLGLDNYPN